MTGWRLPWIAFIPKLPAQLWLLAAAAFVNFLGFMVTPFLVLYLNQVAHFSIEAAGAFLTCFGIGGIAGTWCGGKLTDRIGAPNVLIVSFVVSAAAMTVIPASSDPLLIAAILSVLAFASGAFRPAYDACVIKLCPEDERSRAYAVYVVAINIGAGIAASVGGFLYSVRPDLIFYADAATSLFAACIIFFFLKRAATGADVKASKSAKPLGASPETRKGTTFLLVCLASCVLDVVSKQTSATLPIYVTSSYGMGPQAFGQLLTIGYFVFAAAILPVSSWVKRGNPMHMAFAGMSIVAVAFALLPMGSGVPVLVCLYLLITLGQLLFYPAIMSIVMGIAAKHGERSGEYMGFYRTAQSIAGVGAPSVGAAIYSQLSPIFLWIFCAVLTLASALALSRRTLG